MQNPPNQQDPDQDLRRNTGMEDSKLMTIEFLRARLLSERSVSKTARQRADELTKRVLELEEELKIVSLQRKKAEMAAIDVLVILKNNGIGELSEEFDSTSDQDMIHCESKAGQNSPEEESSVDSKMRRNHADELSGSELESSPLSGRSLSWKGGKDFPRSHEKKCMDSPIRRRSSSVSTMSTSSRRRVGQSCRQIRRRESRSAADESQSHQNMLAPQQNGVATFSEGLPSLSDTGTEILREGAEQDANIFLAGPGSGELGNQRMVANGRNYLNAHGSGEDMERALAHQAQLIGQYEEEEKAQREWEEKFRENNGSTPDSCEPGNHSDVTEERDETKDDAPPDHVGTTASQDQEAKSKAEKIRVIEESSESQPNGFQSPPLVDLRGFQDQRSQPSDFEFPVATANQNMQSSVENHGVSPSHGYHHRSHSECPAGNQSSRTAPSENALILHEMPDKLESVLEALHQAKLSLKHKAYSPLPPIDSASVGKATEFSVGDRRPEVPVGCPGLFRVLSDIQLEATVKSNSPGSNSQLSLTNHYPDSGNALSAVDHFTTPFTVSSSSISTGNKNLSGTNLYRESRSRIPDPPENWSKFPYYDRFPRPSFGTDLPLSRRYAYTDSIMDAAALVSSSSTFVSPLYPYPNLMPRFPSDEGKRLFSSMGAGITPSNRFSSYDDFIRLNNMSSSGFSSPAYQFQDVMPRIPSEERSRLFSSSGVGIPPQNRLTLENDHLRRNMYR